MGYYCPVGHEWVTVTQSLLSGPYAYCPECDKLYHFRPLEIKKREIKISGRFEDMKRLAKVRKARSIVTESQLEKLGLIDRKK